MQRTLIHPSYVKSCESFISSLGYGILDSIRRDAWKSFKKRAVVAHKLELKKSAFLSLLPFAELKSHLDNNTCEESIPKEIQTWSMEALNEKGKVPSTLASSALKCLAEGNSTLFSLGVAMMSYGKLLLVPEGASCSLKLSHLAPDGKFCHSFHIIFVSKGATLDLYEDSNLSGFGNFMVHFVLSEGAKVNHYHIQNEFSGSYLSRLRLDLSKNASYKRYHLSFGSDTCFREEIFANLKGIGSSADFYGVHSTKDSRRSEHLIQVTHSASETNSSQFYKGLLMDKSSGLFQGAILIDKNCHQVDGQQQSKSLLLSPDVKMYNQPALDICSQDVSCNHGAAIGQIDKSSLFYLKSRGIDEREGERIICKGFVLDILSKIPDRDMKNLFIEKFVRNLEG